MDDRANRQPSATAQALPSYCPYPGSWILVSQRFALIAGVILCCWASPASAQPAPSRDPVGVWRGTSLCQVRPSACNDESTVYRITRINTADSISIDARKVVNGKEEEMGVLGCRLDAGSAQITCSMPNGVWHFALRRDSLVGELRLPDGRKYRDIRAMRSTPVTEMPASVDHVILAIDSLDRGIAGWCVFPGARRRWVSA